jgi:hypothetical protein
MTMKAGLVTRSCAFSRSAGKRRIESSGPSTVVTASSVAVEATTVTIEPRVIGSVVNSGPAPPRLL